MSNRETTYSEAQIHEKLAAIPGWYFEDGWIRRYYKTDGWPQTMLLVNAIAFVAEAANHHPDLSVTWARVGVKLQTHSAGGITDKDLALARQIEEWSLWRPPAGGPLEGNPKKFVQSGDRR
jgi:4a-hydroxytetrahydrobiopterin dehydratase